MKVKHFIGLFGLILGGVALTSGVYADESYQTQAELKFNFSNTISIALKGVTESSGTYSCGNELSSAELSISNLTPGQSGVSNAICIDVSTNSLTGHNVLASMGSSGSASTNLTHTNGTSVFTSVGTSASLASLTTPGTWGYATSSNGSTYSNYSGIAAYTAENAGTTIGEHTSSDDKTHSQTYFRIGAYAASGQVAGDYTNTINFYAVSAPDSGE